MTLYEVLLTRRSIRQFKAQPVSRNILEKLVNAARLAPSAANIQPLEFVVVDEEEVRGKIFSCLRWAAYIAPQGNPRPGHEPMAYIIILANTGIKEKGYEYDAGAAIENMILAAWDQGIGSCWLLSVERDKIQAVLEIPKTHRIDSVLALGYPDEEPAVEVMEDSVKYWKDSTGRLHVPKRKLEDIIHFNKF
ncbi:MAG: nitroreductase [Candidatus Aminicenantes bacterium]|nr:nitroreductase [Candidatus Aminicenantes bacterium]